ncbi:MAG TPA: universal stress protein [Lacunisphaera sp.]|nr:universal stress protein [Lacunisphaera sp.]
MKTILVPLDLSAAAVQVCNAACDLARQVGGRLVLLHVVQPPPVVMSEVYAFDAGQLTEMASAAQKAAAQSLRALDRHCAKRQVGATTMLRTGAPVAAILAKATSSRAAYIVMGSHGHSAIYDLLVGSTTHGVLMKAPCPVVVVPPASRRSRTPRGRSPRRSPA